MISLFNKVSKSCSKLITTNYSTSFSLGIRMFHPKFRDPIYSIYGFVRFADEIVDTMHEYDKKVLLQEFKEDTFKAIERKISMNPVLNSFQEVVHKYHIEDELIHSFLDSMEMDLHFRQYGRDKFDEYIYGSAEVVGLMCLRVFCESDDRLYQQLKEPARKLGAAFQKVNFLRDMKNDYDIRERVYFPNVDFNSFDQADKSRIEKEIRNNFVEAYKGIKQLPKGTKMGVYLAYAYYSHLLKKIEISSPSDIKKRRFRLNDGKKAYLILSSAVRNQFNLI